MKFMIASVLVFLAQNAPALECNLTPKIPIQAGKSYVARAFVSSVWLERNFLKRVDLLEHTIDYVVVGGVSFNPPPPPTLFNSTVDVFINGARQDGFVQFKLQMPPADFDCDKVSQVKFEIREISCADSAK